MILNLWRLLVSVMKVKIKLPLGVLATALSSEVAEVAHGHSGGFVWVNPEIAEVFW